MGCCLTYPGVTPLRPPHEEKKSYAKLQAFGDAEICYSLEGEEKAPLMVLLHGIEGGMWMYEKLNTYLLSKGYRVLRFDMYGRGGSDLPAAEHSLNFYVEQVDGLLKFLNLLQTRKTLVGHSMGGAISVGYAARYGEYVDSLILLAPAGYLDDPNLKCLKCSPCCADCIFGGSPNFYVENVMKSIYRPKEQPELAKWMRHNLDNMIKTNPGYLTSVKLATCAFPLDNIDREAKSVDKRIRVLLLWGDKDGEGRWGLPYLNHKLYLQAIPHAEFHGLKDVHHAFFVEDPHLTHGLISQFLEKK
jgi:pimeloyl-ACP methyl ester carboxylesterase